MEEEDVFFTLDINDLTQYIVHPRRVCLNLHLSEHIAATDASELWKRNRSVVGVWVNVINCAFARSMMRSPVEIDFCTFPDLLHEFRALREKWAVELESQQ